MVVIVKADDFYGHCGSNLTQSRSFFSRLLLRPFWGRENSRWWPTLFFFDQREPRCRRQRGFEFPEGFFSALFANKTTLKKGGSHLLLQKKVFWSIRNFFSKLIFHLFYALKSNLSIKIEKVKCQFSKKVLKNTINPFS